jgi:tellurite resistance protein TehA-like permease
MATGIVSTALLRTGLDVASGALALLATVGFVALLVLLVVRVVRTPRSVWLDAQDPRRAFGFFTIVAAIGVLAVRFADVAPTATAVAVIVAGAVWLVVVYAIPAAVILTPHREPVSAHIDGSWFLWVVATQSVSVGLSSGVDGSVDAAGTLAVVTWSIGIVLYLILATLILLRLLTVPNRPDDLSPAYWIFTGATAISALAASRILLLPADLPIRETVAEFVSATAVVLWSFGTWWIPMLVIFGVWRHVVKRRPFRYESGLWSIVFPLGMYAVASRSAGEALGLSFLGEVGTVATVVAAAAWFIVVVLMLAAGVRFARSSTRTVAHTDSTHARSQTNDR